MSIADILLNIGYLIILLALSIKEILWLRITMTIAQALILIANIAFNDNSNFFPSRFVLVNTVISLGVTEDVISFLRFKSCPNID